MPNRKIKSLHLLFGITLVQTDRSQGASFPNAAVQSLTLHRFEVAKVNALGAGVVADGANNGGGHAAAH